MPETTPDELLIFTAALEQPAAERDRFLQQACGSDQLLRARIQKYLHAHQQSHGRGPLDEPPACVAATVQSFRAVSRVGETIDCYTLRELLGEGGMGDVYVAEQQEPVRRKVALKVIKPGMDSREVISRFESERQALALMDHPNIAKVLQAGTAGDGRPFFVMELVRGVPITEFCDRQQMNVQERLRLFLQVCQAVQHAHQKGIIHRDLKPSNVLATMADTAPVAKVIDFGVAKAVHGPLTDHSVYTGFHQMIGTPMYMSPEQAGLSALDIDTRSDIYSLGVLLYELLTGATPFAQQQFQRLPFDELRRMIREVEPLRPSARLSTLEAQKLSTICEQRKVEPRHFVQQMRGELDWVVMKALEKDRSRRYEWASALAADVQRLLNNEPVEACPPSIRYRVQKFVRRHRPTVVAGAALLLLLILGVLGTSAGMAWAMREQQKTSLAAEAEVKQRRRAEQQRNRARQAEAVARDEAAIAKAVNEFLVNDLLAQADPSLNARGSEVTVEQLLDRAAARIEGKFPDQPRVEAAVRLSIGNSYLALGNFPAAESQLEKSLNIFRDQLGARHPDTLQAANDLAGTYVEQGRYDEAQTLQTRVLQTRREMLGPEHPDTLAALQNLAGLYVIRGDLARAEPLCVEAVTTMRRVLGNDDQHTLGAISNLASLYRDKKQYDKAEPLAVEVLQTTQRVLGENNRRTLIAMNNLASLYIEQQEFAKAEPLLRQIVEAGRHLLGADHPDVLVWMGNLAQVYARQQRHAEAEQIDVVVLTKRRETIGADHPHTLTAMENLAQDYLHQGKYSEAESLYGELIAAQKRLLDATGPQLLSSLENLATTLVGQGKIQQSLEISQDIVQLRRQTFGDQAPETLKAISDLAQLHLFAGEVDEAEKLYLQVVESTRQTFENKDPRNVSAALESLCLLYEGKNEYSKAKPYRGEIAELTKELKGPVSPEYAAALYRQAANLMQQDEYVSAEAKLRECLAIYEQARDPGIPTISARVLLGRALTGQKRFAEAESLLLESDSLARRDTGMSHRGVIQSLLTLYEQWNKPDELAKWRGELMGLSN